MCSFGGFRCGAVDRTWKQYYLFRTPNILIIQLKRFRANGSKISTSIQVPARLDLSGSPYNKSSDALFHLYGYISHFGGTTSSGHYTACMRGFDRNWYHFDDESVALSQLKKQAMQDPYILFYYNDRCRPLDKMLPKKKACQVANNLTKWTPNNTPKLIT